MAGMTATNDTEKTDAAKTDDVITRLAGKGEEAIRRIVDLPGGQRALEAFNDLKLRVDDLSKKVRGVDATHYKAHLAAAKLGKNAAVPDDTVIDAWIDEDGLARANARGHAAAFVGRGER